MNFSLFISCPKGLEYLLEAELRELGLSINRVSSNGVYGEADLELIYKLCLWSRIANRVQLILFSKDAHDAKSIYQLCRNYQWDLVFSPDKTLAIEFHGFSAEIRNSMFGAQVVKDGVVDYYRELYNCRPTIVRDHPQILLHAYLKNDTITLSFDLTGYSLHQRGYRLQAGLAPLKENVAAALLVRAGWGQLAAKGYALHDPFCGAGTIAIEAAMMAAGIAPGSIRSDQSLQYWTQHEPLLWHELRRVAVAGIKPIKLKLRATDFDVELIEIARANARRAGVENLIEFEVLALSAIENKIASAGLLISNPPYGERLGDDLELSELYKALGLTLYKYYQGWEVAILSASSSLAKAISLRAHKSYSIFNGALECKLYLFELNADNKLKQASCEPLSAGAQMFANRLAKNYKNLQKWAQRVHISCYRVYDTDLPEYACAIDIYNDRVVLQEYTAPAIIAQNKVAQRSAEILQVVPQVLAVRLEHLVLKQRKPQKGSAQYQKLGSTQHNVIVYEGAAKFKVNLSDYLDTGLFLDHRLLRLRFGTLPNTTKFLNCFAYTATASVHAALSGASTTNVDLSHTYLAWAEDNFRLNQLDLSKHRFIQADCLVWLKNTREYFDVIFLDPPSFSNSKRMSTNLDIVRDHELLIRTAMNLLYPGGILYFSTNLRAFKLSAAIFQQYKVRDISTDTIDLDFKRNQRIHHCFMLIKE